jgi:hypothetical protein
MLARRFTQRADNLLALGVAVDGWRSGGALPMHLLEPTVPVPKCNADQKHYSANTSSTKHKEATHHLARNIHVYSWTMEATSGGTTTCGTVTPRVSKLVRRTLQISCERRLD